jgi:coenzyme F420-reducing hydrogenase beta subunit
MFLHKAIIALEGIVVNGVVFVEVKGDDVFKAETFIAVEPDELGVE